MTKLSEHAAMMEQGIILGIYVDVTGAALRSHARKREKHHERRAIHYFKLKKKAAKADQQLQEAWRRDAMEAADKGYTQPNRPALDADRHEADRRRHVRLEEFFAVMAEFASREMTYRLDPDGMVRLEFVETQP